MSLIKINNHELYIFWRIKYNICYTLILGSHNSSHLPDTELIYDSYVHSSVKKTVIAHLFTIMIQLLAKVLILPQWNS